MATIPDLTNAETWPDDDLDRLRVAVLTEQERRYTLAAAPALAEQTAARYRNAVEAALPPLGAGEHRAWAQPLGGHDAYPRGAVVAHKGRVWESRNPANVWEPGGTGVPAGLWADVTSDAPDPTPTPTGTPWDGNGKAYKIGDIVTYKGSTYKVTGAHSSQSGWAPDVAVSLFAKM